jgi:hypothetical protein
MNIGNRIEIVKELDDVIVHIKPRKHIFLLLFLPVWLTGWTFGGIAAMAAVARGESQGGFLILWLCGWLVGEIFASIAWLWNAFGREVVILSKGFFTYKRELFGTALTAKTVSIQKLSNLRATGFFSSMWSMSYSMAQWGFTGGTIAVDEGWDTYRFGNGLEEKEAVALVEAVKP